MLKYLGKGGTDTSWAHYMCILINSNNNQMGYLLLAIFLRWGLFYFFEIITELENGEAKFETVLSDYEATLFTVIRLP